MTKRRWLLLIAAALAFGGAAGCEETLADGDGGAGGDGGVPSNDAATLPSGIVTFRGAGQPASAAFTSGNERYLVVPYSVSEQQTEAAAYTITVTGAQGSSSASLKSTGQLRQSLRDRAPELWARWQRRLASERWTRSVAERTAKLELTTPHGGDLLPLAGESCTKSSECVAATEVCHRGSCVNELELKTTELTGTEGTITVTVAHKGSRAAVLLEQGVTLAPADLEQITDRFNSVIYPRSVALFGNPVLRDGQPTLASDRNGDGLVWLVLTPKVADRGGAVGFFVATDFAPVAEEPKSNEADILYLLPPGGETTVADLATITAHELQHLLGFASKVYRAQARGQQGAIEALWLDEGQSHFAEDACGYGGENATLLEQELLPRWDSTAMISADDSLPLRAMALTFVRYLFEQRGGASYNADGTISDAGGGAWLAALHTSDKQGTEAIDATYGPFKSAFDRWVATIALDGRGVTDSSLLNYKAPITDPITGNLVGLRIRGRLRDASGADVVLEGPLEDALGTGETSGEIPNAASKFYLLEGLSGTAQINVTSEAPDFRYAVIKLR